MKITHNQGDPRSLTLLAENARHMRHETFARLVANIRDDGVLTQWPFVWHNTETSERTVLSGNHRVMAAIEAGLTSIDWTECDEPLTPDRRLGIQLSHNSITGEDDPTVLKRLYESIEEVDEKLYAGLDDAMLELMQNVDTSSLSEANLDFTTIALVFLPPERERAEQALRDAKALLSPDATWLARNEQYTRLLDALEDARSAAHVMNTATAFDLLLDVWDRHRDDLTDLWLDKETDTPKHKHQVPTSSLLGHTVPAEQAARVAKAAKKLKLSPWQAVAQWADQSLDAK